ncbi:hypothetical protein FCULG_00008603 [Fusarium culmorum]|uniref:Uncharacterized protein n=1 Tax=Fusarium culmorum TaxID=5516 RepID=A0A2T4H0Y7_FUSCU|nr:hypothetical protein FCULG_00008603 [Fusarium culmorum]
MHSKTEPSPWNWLAYSCKEVLRIQWLVGGLSTNNAGWPLFTQAPGSWGSRESSEHRTTAVHTGAVPVLYVCCKSWAMPRYTKRLESDLTRVFELKSKIVAPQSCSVQHWRGEVRVADDVSSARDELLPTL